MTSSFLLKYVFGIFCIFQKQNNDEEHNTIYNYPILVWCTGGMSSGKNSHNMTFITVPTAKVAIQVRKASTIQWEGIGNFVIS